jgi:hypothetical protein
MYENKLMDESIVWTREELSAIQAVLYCALACCRLYCPDAKWRAFAARQLSDPFWNSEREFDERWARERRWIRSGG